MPSTDFWSENYPDAPGGGTQYAGASIYGADPSGASYGGGDDTNAAGAADDPFAYTKGSLLTPWEGHWDPSKYPVGGGGPAPYTPFNYGALDYKPQLSGSFDERYTDPGNFVYGDYTGQGAFKAPTEADMKADPGYEARLNAGVKAVTAQKAMQGILRSGGAAKAINNYAGDQASQEYGNVYGRRQGEYQMAEDQNRFKYTTNRGNAKDAFDTNVNNRLTGFNTRLNAFKTNADVLNANANTGWQVASGEWDRNEGLARQQYEDLRSYQNAVASAAASGNAQAYERALDAYKMARDEFYTNQDRQYSILNDQDNKGRDAAYQYANFSAGNAMARGNAGASGVVGSANASAAGASNIGNNAMDFGLYASMAGRGLPRPSSGP